MSLQSLSNYQAWAYLTWDAKEAWAGVFPSGKVPVLPIAAQRVRFVSFKDPESVFSIDCRRLELWQLVLLDNLGLDLLDGFCFGRFDFCAIGVGDFVFWSE